MDNGNPVQQEPVLSRIEHALMPALRDDRWPKPSAFLAVEIAGGLCVGLLLGKMIFGSVGAAPALNPAQGQWARATNAGFEILLPKGWENFTAEANIGVPADAKREIVFRQKGSTGTRLFVLEKAAMKPNEAAAMGGWMAAQRREMLKLRQQMGTMTVDNTPGLPALTFHVIKPAGGPQVVSGNVVFRGAFYGYSYATPYSNDNELLLSLLGSMREAKAGVPPAKAVKPAAHKPAPKPAAKASAKPAKKKK